MRIFLLLAAFAIGTKAGAYTDLDSARRAFNATDFTVPYASHEERKSMALAINDYWQDLNTRLPRLSPREMDWISNELNTTDMERIQRVSRTREYNLWVLGSLVDQCQQAVRDLLASIDNASQEQFEMFHWTKVASCYHRSDGGIFQNLNGAGLDQVGDAQDGHTLDSLILTKILNVIAPSAMADTMGWTLSQD